MTSQDSASPSDDDHSEFKFSTDTSLEELRAKVHKFAEERDWDQYHTPRNLLLAMISFAEDARLLKDTNMDMKERVRTLQRENETKAAKIQSLEKRIKELEK